jgi:hypothetical protein
MTVAKSARNHERSIRTKLARLVVLGGACAALSGAAAGCLSRPVTKQEPTTKVNFTTNVAQKAVDKIDLLLAIDNSASMADKQQFLASAVPDLLNRLLTPNCINSTSLNPTGTSADLSKPEGQQCGAGNEPEFKPISDIHIAIVSSSLGAYGDTDICNDADAGKNDHGHLILRGTMGNVADADPAGFLAWFPANEANKTKKAPSKPITSSTTLINDFKDLVVGTGQSGCGLEAQLESFYHFLIQPDPWQSVKIGNPAAYVGVDETILAQRAAFLRPDSLVAVVMLTDEDDSFTDPLSVGGQGWAFSTNNFNNDPNHQPRTGGGTTAPLPTKACATDPGSDACATCAYATSKNDPNCKTANGGYYGPDDDSMNVRFFHMRQRFGVDPQYPIGRYVQGLSGKKVPYSSEEHTNDSKYQVGPGSCVNPLFAAALPNSLAAAIAAAPAKDANGKALSDADRQKSGLCNLPQGTRDSKLVFFALIGGVPNELLHFDPASPQKSKLSGNDWVKILGTDPLKFNYAGIDPHMIQSIDARPGLPPASTTSGDNGSDKINGREWDTKKGDLQFACTFPLPMAQFKTCAKAGDGSCSDCNGNQNPPLCGTNPLQQVRAKAYPTIRQLEVVHALNDQGIAASLCPRTKGLLGVELEDDTVNGAANPLYGYRPAVKAIVDRLKDALTEQCLPEQLTLDPSNNVPCLILATLPTQGTEADCAKYPGLTVPAADILTKFQQAEVESAGGDAGALLKFPVCVLPEIPIKPGDTCKSDQKAGWCYVQNSATATPAGRCPQAIIFTSGTDQQIKGASYSLQCIQQFGSGTAAGDTPAGDGG